jgi:hypothetical protein
LKRAQTLFDRVRCAFERVRPRLKLLRAVFDPVRCAFERVRATHEPVRAPFKCVRRAYKALRAGFAVARVHFARMRARFERVAAATVACRYFMDRERSPTMSALRHERFEAVLAEYGITAGEAFHVLMTTLTDSHLRTLRENLRTCQPTPTILLAAELAVRNELDFTAHADPDQKAVLGLRGALRCAAEESERE